jgi:hypothetical protein
MVAPNLTIHSETIITSAEQARSTTGPSSWFFRVYGASHAARFDRIQPGWTVVAHPTWVVTSVVPDASDNNESCTITISGGSFIQNTFYVFTGPLGVTIGNGVTIT